MTYETREIIRARRELDKLNSIPLQQKKEAKQKETKYMQSIYIIQYGS